MRDDERYPISTQTYPDQELPEVVTYSTLPEHDPSHGGTSIGGTTVGPTPVSAEKSSPAAAPEVAAPAERSTGKGATICGLRRRTFWIVLAVVVLGVIAALVGGLVGGLKARESGSDGDSGSSPPQPTPTGPLDPKKRSVGASSSGGADGNSLQVFYQDIDTTDVLYRLNWGDSFSKEQRANLKIAPNQGTPLATTTSSRSGNQGVEVNLFYLSTNSTSHTTIVRAVLDCSQGAATCSTTSSGVISNDFANGVHPSSGLAAMLLDDAQNRFRVYFRASKGLVWAMVGDQPAQNGWSFHQIGGPTPEGSTLSASVQKGQDQIMVALVTDSDGLLQSVEYKDAIGPKGVHPVDGTPGSGFVPTTKFAACYEPVADVYHVYYVAQLTGDIIGYFRPGMDSDWKTNQAPEWGVSDGGIAASSWDDHVRIIYMNKGKLAMNKMDNGTWSNIEYL